MGYTFTSRAKTTKNNTRPLFVQIRRRRGQLELFVRTSPEFEQAMAEASPVTRDTGEVSFYTLPGEELARLETLLPRGVTLRTGMSVATRICDRLPRPIKTGDMWSVWCLRVKGMSSGKCFPLGDIVTKEHITEYINHVKATFLVLWQELLRGSSFEISLTVTEKDGGK